MAHIHLFEWEDQPWFPGIVRDALTAFLSFYLRVSGHGAALVPKLIETIQRTKATRVIDLCSGAGAPAALVAEQLVRAGIDIQVHCTDLFPNVPALTAVANASKGRVSFEPTPIDATNLPASLEGVRTVFNALHHFRPDMARRILEGAVHDRQAIAVFEIVSRPMLIGMLFVPLMVLFAVPFLRPFRWPWIPLTYFIPVIPLVVAWDGFVSCLRVYTRAELHQMVDGLEGYEWEMGRIPLPGSLIPASYLVGIPIVPDAEQTRPANDSS